MKKIIVFILFIGWLSLFGQIPDSGTWIMKDKIQKDSLYSNSWLQRDSDLYLPPDTAFTPLINDSIMDLYAYVHAPHMIQFNQHGMILIYGDVLDPDDHVVAKERTLYSQKGDCIFAWEPSTSMYEYVITWDKDHFVYYTSHGTEYHYLMFDTDILSQQQKEKLIPKDEMWAYFQGRLRPIPEYCQCNFVTEK